MWSEVFIHHQNIRIVKGMEFIEKKRIFFKKNQSFLKNWLGVFCIVKIFINFFWEFDMQVQRDTWNYFVGTILSTFRWLVVWTLPAHWNTSSEAQTFLQQTYIFARIILSLNNHPSTILQCGKIILTCNNNTILQQSCYAAPIILCYIHTIL